MDHIPSPVEKVGRKASRQASQPWYWQVCRRPSSCLGRGTGSRAGRLAGRQAGRRPGVPGSRGQSRWVGTVPDRRPGSRPSRHLGVPTGYQAGVSDVEQVVEKAGRLAGFQPLMEPSRQASR